MPEANAASKQQAPAQKVIAELKVSGHLMALDPGLFCIVQMPSRAADPATGLPGVRISLPPGPVSRPEAVSISTFRPDGWLHGGGDAALVRVLGGPAQVLVTIYQSPLAKDGAPSLQVLRLLEPAPGAAGTAGARPPPPAPVVQADQMAPPAAMPGDKKTLMEMVAHIQGRGDVGAMLGDWLGEKGSKSWIEGFGIAPNKVVAPKDIEYQAVLGRGWLSPWVEGGQFCGSRGMALPVLGLRLRLRGAAADTHDVFYSATFVDGTEVGPVAAGDPCEAESLAAMESFQITVNPKGAAAAKAPAKATEAAAPAAKPAAKAKTKAPAAEKPVAPSRKR
jgi:Clostridial hydrophobic W